MNLFSIVEYFNKFGGKHNKWDLRRGKFGDFYVVQFTCDEDAENVLKKRYHRIQNYIFTVEKYDVSRDKNAAGKRFFRVTEDNWYKILNDLDVIDLCAVANTCTALKSFGEVVFASKFDTITWRADDENANDIFKTFGHLITNLDVDIVKPCAVQFDLIVNKCTKNLRSLSIWMNALDQLLNDNTKLGLQKLFSQLHQLNVNCWQFFDYTTAVQLLTHCAQLQSLSINCSSPFDPICNRININFTQLTKIKFQLNASINDAGLKMLLSFNPHLKKLYIDECPLLTAKSIEIIAHCVPWLEELTLGPLKNFSQADLYPIGGLYGLKRVQILFEHVTPLMNVINDAGILIESLTLWYVSVNDAVIEQLARMKSIKVLFIFSCTITNQQLKIIAEKLPLLTELRLAGSEHVTIDGVADMLYVTPNLSALHLNNMKNIEDNNRLLTLVERASKNAPSIVVENF